MTYREWQRWRGCGRKQAWQSERLAANYALLLSWRDGRPYTTYRCEWCDLWHATKAREEAA